MKRNTGFADSTLQHIAQLRYVHELLAVQRLLTRNHIESIHLKGVTQSMFLSEKWLKRIPVDIDLLIRRIVLAQSIRVLARLDYHMIPQSSDASEVLLIKPGQRGPQLELHLSALIPLPLRAPFNTLPLPLVESITEEFFQRSRHFQFLRRRFRILETEDMLLHQCLNFFFHHSCRSDHQLSDIALIINEQPLNWSIIISRLTGWNLKEFAYYPLLLAKDVESVHIPEFVFRKIRPRNFLSYFVPLLVNAETVHKPIHNGQVRYRYNMLLRFLIVDQSLFQKLRSLCSRQFIWNMVKKLQWLFHVLFNVTPIKRRTVK